MIYRPSTMEILATSLEKFREAVAQEDREWREQMQRDFPIIEMGLGTSVKLWLLHHWYRATRPATDHWCVFCRAKSKDRAEL